MHLGAGEFASVGCGLVTNRDINAARNNLRCCVLAAGWGIGLSSRPGPSEDVRGSYVAGLPGLDSKRHVADCCVRSSVRGSMGRSNANRGPEGLGRSRHVHSPHNLQDGT